MAIPEWARAEIGSSTVGQYDYRYGIYGIVCWSDRGFYIGSMQIAFAQRLHQHVHLLERGLHFNLRLQAAHDLHGLEDFVVLILEAIKSHRYVAAAEQRWIEEYRVLTQSRGWKLYNVAPPSRKEG